VLLYPINLTFWITLPTRIAMGLNIINRQGSDKLHSILCDYERLKGRIWTFRLAADGFFWSQSLALF